MPISSLEITIPVLNEAAELRANTEKVLHFLESAPLAKRAISLVIADNGSTDATPEIGRALAAGHPGRVRFLRVSRRGVGLALKESWGSSSAQAVGYFDLDLATDMAHLPQALAALDGGADVVYGTRLHRDSVVAGRTLKREITSRAFNFILKAYLGVRFSDGMCGFKFLRRDRLPELLAGGAVSDGWFFSTELLTVAQWRGFKVFELPVRWTDSPDSRVRILPLAMQYLRAMKTLKARRPEGR